MYGVSFRPSDFQELARNTQHLITRGDQYLQDARVGCDYPREGAGGRVKIFNRPATAGDGLQLAAANSSDVPTASVQLASSGSVPDAGSLYGAAAVQLDDGSGGGDDTDAAAAAEFFQSSNMAAGGYKLAPVLSRYDASVNIPAAGWIGPATGGVVPAASVSGGAVSASGSNVRNAVERM